MCLIGLKQDNVIQDNLIRNILIFSELDILLASFDKAGLDVLILKGAALAATVYPDIGTRQMADIDVMVKKEQLPEIRKLLKTLQFTLVSEGFIDIHPGTYIKHGKFSIFLDLHTTIKHMGMDSRNLWANAVKINLSGKCAFVLGPDHTLIHLLVHLLQHRYIHQKWLRDIHFTISHYKDRLNWEYIVQVLNQHRIRVPGYYLLEKTVKMHQTPVPASVSKEFEKHPVLKRICAVLMDRGTPIPNTVFFLPILAKPGIIKRVNYVFQQVFPSKKFMELRYKHFYPSVSLFFYLFRMIILGLKTIHGVSFLGVLLIRDFSRNGLRR